MFYLNKVQESLTNFYLRWSHISISTTKVEIMILSLGEANQKELPVAVCDSFDV